MEGGTGPLRLSFGAVAATYDRMRPGCFAPLLDRAVEVLGLAATARALHLAGGAGRLTRELVERFAHVVAVEPSGRRRRLF